jgi:hypothetical protein
MPPTNRLQSEAKQEEAWRKFEESERILNLLRAHSASPIQSATPEYVLQWNTRIQHPQEVPCDSN